MILRDLSYIIAILIEILLPLILAIIIAKKFKVSWSIFFLGLGLFIFSLIRIPLNNFVNSIIASRDYNLINSSTLILLFSSITAGIFEEGVRVLGIGYIIRNKNYWKGIMYGIGHGGGGEAMVFVGFSTLANYIIFRFFPSVLSTGIIEQYNQLAWYIPLVGALERIFAIGIQIFLSVLIMYAFMNKRYWVIAVAVLSHIFIDFISVYIYQKTGSMLILEIIVFVIFIICLVFTFILRPKENPKELNT